VYVQLGFTGALHLAIELKIVLAVVGPRKSRQISWHVHLRERGREGGREGGRG